MNKQQYKLAIEINEKRILTSELFVLIVKRKWKHIANTIIVNIVFVALCDIFKK